MNNDIQQPCYFLSSNTAVLATISLFSWPSRGRYWINDDYRWLWRYLMLMFPVLLYMFELIVLASWYRNVINESDQWWWWCPLSVFAELFTIGSFPLAPRSWYNMNDVNQEMWNYPRYAIAVLSTTGFFLLPMGAGFI